MPVAMLSDELLAWLAKAATLSKRTVRRWWQNPLSVHENTRRRLDALMFARKVRKA